MSETSTLTQIVKDLILNIRKYSIADIYLFGSSLRSMILTGNIIKLDVCVAESDKDIKNKILNDPSIDKTKFNIIFESKFDYSHEYYTMDNIFCRLPDNFDGNIELLSTNNGLVDLNKKIIKLTKAGKNKLLTDPTFIFETISLISKHKFILDSVTISSFLQNKSVAKKVNHKYLVDFIESLLTYEHPRKIVSLINTLGISKELFGVKLYETSIINHLKSDDVYEFIAILFSDVEIKDLKNVLYCYSPKDIDMIKNIMSTISEIENEDIITARKILKAINMARVQSMIRLLFAMKLKTLAKIVRSEKDNIFSFSKLCVDESIIKSTFKNINENEVKVLLNKARNKILANPEYNDIYKMLSYLNEERKICQENQ